MSSDLALAVWSLMMLVDGQTPPIRAVSFPACNHVRL